MKNYLWKISILSVIFVVAFTICCSLMFTQDAKYEKETAYKVVSYLGERKIKVDEDKIDIKKKYVFDMDLESVTVDKTQVSTNILGKEPSVLADTYTSEAGTVAFKGTDLSFKPTEEFVQNIAKKTNLYDAGKKSRKLVEMLGFDVDGSRLLVSENDENIRVDITKTVEGLKVFNNCISVEVDEEGLVQLWGRWYNTKSPLRDKREAKPIADALILFSQDNVNDKEIEIKEIELGYLLTDTSLETTTLRPVWRIETDTDGNVYIDA